MIYGVCIMPQTIYLVCIIQSPQETSQMSIRTMTHEVYMQYVISNSQQSARSSINAAIATQS